MWPSLKRSRWECQRWNLLWITSTSSEGGGMLTWRACSKPWLVISFPSLATLSSFWVPAQLTSSKTFWLFSWSLRCKTSFSMNSRTIGSWWSKSLPMRTSKACLRFKGQLLKVLNCLSMRKAKRRLSIFSKMIKQKQRSGSTGCALTVRTDYPRLFLLASGLTFGTARCSLRCHWCSFTECWGSFTFPFGSTLATS